MMEMGIDTSIDAKTDLGLKVLLCRCAWLKMRAMMNLLKAEIEAVREEMDNAK